MDATAETNPTTPPPFTVRIRDTKPKDYRCPHCGRLLMRAVLIAGCYIETRCPRNHCGRMCVFTNETVTLSSSV